MEKEAYYDEVETLEFQPSCNKESKVVPEIVEIEEETDDELKGVNCGSKENDKNEDVYVAVGKDDVHVLKWVLAHVVVTGARVNLIHVSHPISTPVGRLWVGQLSPEQTKIFATEEHNKRKNLLNKYIRLCLDNKVDVDTILIESSETTKAILNLIPLLNMTSLFMGTKHQNLARRLIKGSSKGALIQKSAPDYCKVSLIYIGNKNVDNRGKIHHISSSFVASNDKQTKVSRHKYEESHKECTCLSVKFS
ncbi:U-box domain-containing protein 33-like [Chenopodium quinoa]|uniref:U-box domain-containing protein 33-like n=1 Tax=Chenopodium quinoa TaxID=63459 RepID=UPI000B76EAFD|nr:U-box domain-containing protein 33-like [Chenopodium quinoa]